MTFVCSAMLVTSFNFILLVLPILSRWVGGNIIGCSWSGERFETNFGHFQYLKFHFLPSLLFPSIPHSTLLQCVFIFVRVSFLATFGCLPL